MEKAKEEREKREQEGKPKLSAGAHRMAEHFANKAFNDIRDKKEEEIPPWGLMSGKTKGEFGGGRKPTPTTMSDHVRDKSPVRKKSRFFWGTPEEKLMKIRRSLLEAADAISEIADELFSYNMKKIEEDKGKEGVEDEKGIAGCSLDGMKEKTQQNFKTDKTGHQRCRYRLLKIRYTIYDIYDTPKYDTSFLRYPIRPKLRYLRLRYDTIHIPAGHGRTQYYTEPPLSRPNSHPSLITRPAFLYLKFDPSNAYRSPVP